MGCHKYHHINVTKIAPNCDPVTSAKYSELQVNPQILAFLVIGYSFYICDLYSWLFAYRSSIIVF
jgi:hypothetical protein